MAVKLQDEPIADHGNQSRPDEPPHQPIAMGIVRFALEIVAFYAIAHAGWRVGEGGIAGTLLAILFFAIAAGFWGTFSVRDDPSRNPKPVVAVHGWIRLIIELTVYGFAAWSLWVFTSRAASETFLTVLVIATVVGWDRLWWMLRHR